jgi:hypothetical protein
MAEMQDRFANAKLNQTPDVRIMSEEEYAQIPKGRSRSKSSSAIFAVAEEEPFDPNAIPDMSSIWQDKEPLLHRRASTQPSQQTLMWEALRAAQLATQDDMNGQNTDELLEKFKQENMRRFSVAPSMVNRFMSRFIVINLEMSIKRLFCKYLKQTKVDVVTLWLAQYSTES